MDDMALNKKRRKKDGKQSYTFGRPECENLKFQIRAALH
jgi:hypothetical protein